MEMHFHQRATIELHNEEADTFRQIVRLAAERLASAPAHQMRGVPLQRQAGLTGVDLFRVRSMLEKMGQRFGLDITEETWRTADTDKRAGAFPLSDPVAVVAVLRCTDGE